MPINSEVMELIIKSTHIFDNINVASKLHIIKVSPKSNMTIIWIDIWDLQSGSTAKMLINQCFNIGSYVAIICSANMNPSVLQCKNC